MTDHADRTDPSDHTEPAARGDHRDPLTGLPTAHAVLLRLERSGASHEQMAVALGVPVESIPTLLTVAWGKFHEREAGR